MSQLITLVLWLELKLPFEVPFVEDNNLRKLDAVDGIAMRKRQRYIFNDPLGLNF